MDKFIKCPHCGYEYLPAEIYNPKYFLGNPINIVRNINGEILGHEGIEMDQSESFVCENCENIFHVTAKINFYSNDKEESKEFSEYEPLDLFDS